MPTKADILNLAEASLEFVTTSSARIIADYQAHLRGDTSWVMDSMKEQIGEIAKVIDLLAAPLLIHMKEHINHMPMDTYAYLSESINNILETQEALIEILTRRNTK